MMNKMIHIGFGNAVMRDRIIAILSVDSLPVKRLKDSAKERGMLIDATMGRQEKTVIVTDSGHIVISAISPTTVIMRIEGDVTGE